MEKTHDYPNNHPRLVANIPGRVSRSFYKRQTRDGFYLYDSETSSDKIELDKYNKQYDMIEEEEDEDE